MFCWHKWYKWEDKEIIKIVDREFQDKALHYELIQLKICLKCNKKKFRRERL
jgi:hypothetical protein